jgi:hypothetical protein
MSYAVPVEASSKALYATVLNNFYTDSVFNPATNTMTSVSYFPLVPSQMADAQASSNKFTEALVCASQNPAFNCTSNTDCPGLKSSCGHCSQNKCVK